MSNIEKALKKTKKEINKSERTDKVRSGVHSKSKAENPPYQNMAALENSGSIQGCLKRNDLESSSESKLDKSDNLILSAIERKNGENSTEHSPLISTDCDQLMEDSGLVSPRQDFSSNKVKTESVIPATTSSNFDVDDQIVSYYETV